MTLMCRAADVLREVPQCDATPQGRANHQMNLHGL